MIPRSSGLRIAVLVASAALLATACSSSDSVSTEPQEPGTTMESTTLVAAAASTDESTTTSPPPTTGAPMLEPLEVVESFFAAWAANDITAATELTATEFDSSIGDINAVTDLIEYSFAVGQTWDATSCESLRNGDAYQVNCTVEVDDPIAAVIDGHGHRQRHIVVDGKLTEIDFTTGSVESDVERVRVARDADGYAAVCGDPDYALPARNRACGEFLRPWTDEAEAAVVHRDESYDSAEAVAAVEQFYAAWNAGELDDAFALLSPSVTSPAGTIVGPGRERLSKFMAYTQAIPQTVIASVCEAQGHLVVCTVEYRDGLIDALEIEGGNTNHQVVDGLIEFVQLGPQYARSDNALATYARENDDAGFAEACALPEDGLTWHEVGISYNTTCGEFLSTLVAGAASG